MIGVSSLEISGKGENTIFLTTNIWHFYCSKTWLELYYKGNRSGKIELELEYKSENSIQGNIFSD